MTKSLFDLRTDELLEKNEKCKSEIDTLERVKIFLLEELGRVDKKRIDLIMDVAISTTIIEHRKYLKENEKK